MATYKHIKWDPESNRAPLGWGRTGYSWQARVAPPTISGVFLIKWLGEYSNKCKNMYDELRSVVFAHKLSLLPDKLKSCKLAWAKCKNIYDKDDIREGQTACQYNTVYLSARAKEICPELCWCVMNDNEVGMKIHRIPSKVWLVL